MSNEHHVVIVGGGFGGLYLAKSLKRANIRITLIDKRNFHLFQPLLYQVATGALSPANIAATLRGVLKKQKNVEVFLSEVIDFDPAEKQLILKNGTIDYDSLVVATGSENHYFGHDEWKPYAPGLKTLEDAFEIRNRIMMSFESAELESDPDIIKNLLTFIVIGAGATGIELAGAIAEIARHTLKHDFRSIDPTLSKVILIEGGDRVLPTWPDELSVSAEKSLKHLGVEVLKNAMVTNIDKKGLTYRTGGGTENIKSKTIIWAAGTRGSALGKVLAERTGAELDAVGRIKVQEDCSLSNNPEIFVIGDLALVLDEKNNPLPGLAPVAMQQGKYVGECIKKRLKGKTLPGFKYRDRGTMATIGRNAAVTKFNGLRFSGRVAWLLWLFVHLIYIVEFGNRLLIFLQWTWSYFTWNRQARFITNPESDKRNMT